MQKRFFGFFLILFCSPALGQIDTNDTQVDSNQIYKPTPPPGNQSNYAPKKSSASLANLSKAFLGGNLYPVLDFIPTVLFTASPDTLAAQSIQIIDARTDNQKIGFLPVDLDLQKKGYSTIGLHIYKNLNSWLADSIFRKQFITDTANTRKLIIVVNNFWLSHTATEPYRLSDPKLLSTLNYDIDIFSSLAFGYYPQKKITGALTGLYNSKSAFHNLIDSFARSLSEELIKLNYAAKEQESNWQSPADFNDFYNYTIKRNFFPKALKKGVYQTYADFLINNSFCDSIEIISRYNNYERGAEIGCRLIAYKNGQAAPSNQAWGYSDGKSLFVNLGNGFFAKLYYIRDNYVFLHLQNIREERIKKDLLDMMQIGGSHYQILKDYTKAYQLTYQLDLRTGKLQ